MGKIFITENDIRKMVSETVQNIMNKYNIYTYPSVEWFDELPPYDETLEALFEQTMKIERVSEKLDEIGEQSERILDWAKRKNVGWKGIMTTYNRAFDKICDFNSYVKAYMKNKQDEIKKNPWDIAIAFYHLPSEAKKEELRKYVLPFFEEDSFRKWYSTFEAKFEKNKEEREEKTKYVNDFLEKYQGRTDEMTYPELYDAWVEWKRMRLEDIYGISEYLERRGVKQLISEIEAKMVEKENNPSIERIHLGTANGWDDTKKQKFKELKELGKKYRTVVRNFIMGRSWEKRQVAILDENDNIFLIYDFNVDSSD